MLFFVRTRDLQSSLRLRLRRPLGALAICLFVALTSPAMAANEFAGRLRNILPGNSVRAVVQGPQGYLWVASSVGLSRYDGRRFVFVGQSEGITGSVPAMAKGPDGHVWAVSEASSTLLEISETQKIARNIYAMQAVRTIFPENQHIWLGDEAGVVRVELGENRSTRSVRLQIDTEFPRVRALARGADGVLWAGGEGGLWRIENDKMIRLWDTPSINSLFTDPKGVVFASSSDRKLFRIAPGTKLPVADATYNLNETIRAITTQDASTQWVATDAGVTRWRGQTFERFLFERDLPGIGAVVAQADNEGSLWVGTDPGGLLQLPPASPFSIGGAGGQYDLPFGTLPSQNGGVWIMSGAGKLSRQIEGAAVESYEVPHDLNQWSWRNFVEMGKGDLWLGSMAKTLLHLSDGRWERMEKPSKVAEHGVRFMMRTRSGRMYLSYADEGFAFLDRGATWQHRIGMQSPCHGPIVAMMELTDGRIAMGTEFDGICSFDGEQIHRLITFPKGTHSTTFAVDGDDVWAGSDRSGLFYWHAGKLTNVSTEQGLPSPHVGQVFVDGTEYLWLATREGIFRIAKQVLFDTMNGKREKVFALSFGAEDGLPSITCLWGWNATGTVDQQGHIWIATTNGVVMFKDPAHAVETPEAKAIIEEATVNGESLQLDSKAAQVFPRDSGNLFFRYTFPTFAHQHRLRFRYRLRGFDEAWTTVGDRATAGFTNVPPGRYTFEVAAWFDGQDPAHPGPVASARFELTPPFYSWWLFRFAAALMLFAIAAALWVQKKRQRRLQVRAITEERTRIARDLHDTLDQTFVAVGLQLQAATAKLGDPASAETHIERANELIDRGLAEARGSIWALREEHPNQAPLPARLAIILGEMVRGTSVSLKVKSIGSIPELPSMTRDELVKIMREAATNAIRHGKAHKLVVVVEAIPGKLLVSMEDDGSGFDPKQTRPGTHGLQGMLERARGFSGTVDWQSTSTGPATGTKVTATLPIKNAHPPHN
jgi:signal transduction histidine kinase/ligand-binding sensor domain-containing protein